MVDGIDSLLFTIGRAIDTGTYIVTMPLRATLNRKKRGAKQ